MFQEMVRLKCVQLMGLVERVRLSEVVVVVVVGDELHAETL